MKLDTIFIKYNTFIIFHKCIYVTLNLLKHLIPKIIYHIFNDCFNLYLEKMVNEKKILGYNKILKHISINI